METCDQDVKPGTREHFLQSSPQHPLHQCGMKPTLSRGSNPLRCFVSYPPG